VHKPFDKIKFFKDLAESPPVDTTTGICAAYHSALNSAGFSDIECIVVIKEFLEIATKWPKYSGNYHYPVPAPTNESPMEAFYNTRYIWVNQYGKDRRELCTFVAKYLHMQRKLK
jgi:hypothetical protein